MSYILDALRKADEQREQRRTPGLHAQPMAAAAVEGDRRMLAWSAAGLVLLLVIGVGAWLLAQRGKAAPAAAVPVAQAPALPAAVPPPPTVATTTPPANSAPAVSPPAPMQAPAPASRVAAAPSPPPAPAAAARIEPPPAPALPAEPPRVAKPAATATEPSAAASQRGAGASATSASASSEPPPQRGWPPGAPPLAVTGGVHSPTPAQRMLIVNGQVFNEGSEVVPGVTLEQVQPRQAVLRWNGQRYAVPF